MTEQFPISHNYAASVLAIGSELLNGQILNRNAQWISNRLVDAGFVVRTHMTVDDELDAIVAALDHLAASSKFLFVTGGLGPTSDDLTRDAVARWTGQELVYDPSSWTHIEEVFTRFGRTAPATNKQQCWFPDGSDILRNRAGTANGFHLQHRDVRIWVLPGPPREVEAVWTDHVKDDLQSIVPANERLVTRMWRTIGLGESHLAEVLSPVVTGRGVSVAYRAHAPYVETKISYPAFSADKHTGLVREIGTVLGKWMFETDDEDLITILGSELNRFTSVDIYDGATQGQIAQFLSPHIKSSAKIQRQVSLVTSWESHDSPRQFVEQCFAVSGASELALAVAGYDHAGTWAFGVRSPAGTEVVEKPSVYFGEEVRSRNQMAVAALAIKGWLNIIGQMVN
jgi:competence/damage-inducible protein CinA-like protein